MNLSVWASPELIDLCNFKTQMCTLCECHGVGRGGEGVITLES